MNKFYYGKKVDRNIWKKEDDEIYYVHFHFAKTNLVQSFPTIEDARNYRDFIFHEKLEMKKEEARIRIRNEDNQYIKDFEKTYPYNILNAIDFEFADESEFEKALATCYEREKEIIKQYYEEGKNLQQIANNYNITRERVRQIVGKALKRIKHYLTYHKSEEEMIKKENELNKYRNMLIKEFAEKGIYTKDMELVFGDVNLKQHTIEELDLSVRSYNCLRRANIRTLEELVKYSPDDLKKLRNLGNKCIKEIAYKLEERGLSLCIATK